MEKLDLDGVRIYSNTKDDAKDAMDLIDEEVYLSNDANFRSYRKGYIAEVKYANDVTYPFLEGNGIGWFKYLIRAKDAKFKEEKKLRPFESMQEFGKETGIEQVGDVITIKRKENVEDIIPTEHTLLFTGFCAYSDEILDICLGCRSYTFEELKNDYLYLKDDEWHPFGVEV